MLEIIVPKDCDNAPKKRLLQDLQIAHARGNVEEVLSYFTEEVQWDMPEHPVLTGKKSVRQFLNQMNFISAQALYLDQIITHGKEAAVRGRLIFKDKKIRFADFYEFRSAGSKEIKTMTTFIQSY